MPSMLRRNARAFSPAGRVCSFIALCTSFALAACSQADGASPAGGRGDRLARIADNLELDVPSLEGGEVEVVELAPSEVPGLGRGTFTFEGRSYSFLVTDDDTRLFILAGEPVDVSRTREEIAAAHTERIDRDARDAAERAATLASATRTLPAKGPADAPVTIIEFSDFGCPFCRRAAGTVEELLERYPNRVRFVYAHFPPPNHRWARPAAMAATCAAEQDPAAFWVLHDFFFANQREMNTRNVIERSRAVLTGSGVNLERWNACATDASSEAYRAAARSIDTTLVLGKRYHLRGTPAFFLNGRLLIGAQPLEAFVGAVEDALENTN